ncbi:MAG: hypothetical protein IPM56_16150 [Ignavibacteriales bacterium]|nr:MAG: hypothetical protein IPM56_16150 [Ignavibacteriales bacterium]
MFDLSKAEQIAIKYWKLFKPLCVDGKIKVAGSIRRRKPFVKDMEIVCVPLKTLQSKDLFEAELARKPEFVSLVNSFERVKGNGNGKYAQLVLPEGIKLDLFMADENNYGLILLLRTGPGEYNIKIVEAIKPEHYVQGGYLHSASGRIIPCMNEVDFYTITKQKYLEPERRF